MAHVMVLDDEPSICWAFRSFLGDDGHRVSIASSAEQALERVGADPPDVFFVDVRLPGIDGLAALGRIRVLCPEAAVIVMTAHGTMETAVGAVRGGAFDYLSKPFNLEQARRLVSRALEARRHGVGETPTPPSSGTLVGRSAPMQMVFKQVALAATCAEPVLITGESGTGKELVARAVHQNSDRARGPFVAVHLAAMPEGLVERELFGHERGAFTGADAGRPGLLDRASGGTIFFDEVAEAPPAIQAKLLRVLDSGEYRAVGGGSERHLNARVVAATNRDLTAWVRTGAFRADLFYRLSVLPIHLPALRDRRDDIPLLWETFLDRSAPGAGHRLDLDGPVAKALLSHDWPGNVRELKNAADYSARASRGFAIAMEHLPASIFDRIPPTSAASDDLDAAITHWMTARLGIPEADDRDLYASFLATVEVPLLRQALSWASGNQARVARRLGLHRTTLRQKLRQYGLEPSKGD
jgi:DNA-binding NtrC family response regulator